MLVLSRKVGEKLVIGDNITIIVNRIAGNRVTIGIEAPDDVRVIRSELLTFDDTEVKPVAEKKTLRPVIVSKPITLEIDASAFSGFLARAGK